MTRKEALNIFLGNIHKGETIDAEAAKIVSEGLLDILFTNNNPVALKAFDLSPGEKMKTLKEFFQKRPVGRPADQQNIKRAKKDLMDAYENLIYYQVNEAYNCIQAKRNRADSIKASIADACRKVADQRGKGEAWKSISVKYFAAKKRLDRSL